MKERLDMQKLEEMNLRGEFKEWKGPQHASFAPAQTGLDQSEGCRGKVKTPILKPSVSEI